MFFMFLLTQYKKQTKIYKPKNLIFHMAEQSDLEQTIIEFPESLSPEDMTEYFEFLNDVFPGRIRARSEGEWSTLYREDGPIHYSLWTTLEVRDQNLSTSNPGHYVSFDILKSWRHHDNPKANDHIYTGLKLQSIPRYRLDEHIPETITLLDEVRKTTKRYFRESEKKRNTQIPFEFVYR